MLLRYAAVTVASCVALVAGLLLLSPILDVREIQIRRADPRIDAEHIRDALKPFFGEHLLFLSPEQIRYAVRKAVPDIQDVSVTKHYPSTLMLTVTPDPIVARLLIDAPAGSSSGQPDTSVLAGTGTVMTATGATDAPATADYLTDKGIYMAYLPSQVRTGTGLLDLHIVDWGVRPESGKPLVESGILLTMQAAEAQLHNEFGLRTESRTIYLRAREFHIRVPGYSLWFDLRSPLEAQLSRYRTFVQYIGVKAVKDYVDLRIRTMIVYK